MGELSVRYASALFDLALESENPNEYLSQAYFLRETLQTADCQEFLMSPKISTAEKKGFFERVFAGNILDDLLGLFYLMVTKSREAYLVEVLDDFIHMAERHNGKTTATVVSAVTLRESQIETLTALLSKKLSKQVDVAAQVDPSVIGGLYIRVDNFLIDRTIRRRLIDMKECLMGGVPDEPQA